MAGDGVHQSQKKVKKQIGGTTYVVASYFQTQSSTAVDKVQSLIGTNMKAKKMCI